MSTRTRKSSMIAVSLVTAATLALTACQTGGTDSNEPTTLDVGLTAEISTLVPWQARGYVVSQMADFALYDTLIKFNDEGEMLPQLAESWEVSDDLTVTTLHIRDDVKFHNGEQLTAADVAYTLDLVTNPELVEEFGSSTLFAGNFYKSIEATDDYTVVITTAEPLRVMERLRRQPIVPVGSADDPDFGQAPIGSGPFVFKSFESGVQLAVTANPDYWGGKPAIDELTFNTIPDVGAQASALRSGDIQALYDVKPAEYAQVKDVQGLQVLETGRYFSWWMPSSNVGITTDPLVREALGYLFDAEQISASAYDGQAEAIWNPFDLTPIGIGDDRPVEYDPEAAKALFEQAGVLGQTIKIQLLDVYEDSRRMGQLLEQSITAAGMVPELVVLTTPEYLEVSYSAGDNPTWEGILFGAGTMPFPPRDIFGYMVLGNPEVKELRGQMGSAPDDELKELTDEAQRVILDQYLILPSFISPIRTIVPENLKGVEGTAFGDVRWGAAKFEG